MPLSLSWSTFPAIGSTSYNSRARSWMTNMSSNGQAIETQVDTNSSTIATHTVQIAALTAGSGAVVSSGDQNVGYLNGKLVAGSNITFTVGNPSSNETLTIAANAAFDTLEGEFYFYNLLHGVI